MSLTPAALREALATLLNIPAEQLSDTTPLVDQGLDSMRLITLVETLRERGIEADFFELSSLPTLADFQQYLCGE